MCKNFLHNQNTVTDLNSTCADLRMVLNIFGEKQVVTVNPSYLFAGWRRSHFQLRSSLNIHVKKISYSTVSNK